MQAGSLRYGCKPGQPDRVFPGNKVERVDLNALDRRPRSSRRKEAVRSAIRFQLFSFQHFSFRLFRRAVQNCQLNVER
jgi:hypothetical protein